MFELANLDQKMLKRMKVEYGEEDKVAYRYVKLIAIKDYAKSFVQYLPPQQADAVRIIQRVMQGYFKQKDSEHWTRYTTLLEAATVLTEDPETILQPLFNEFVIPSIVATNTPGYSLLQEYEAAHPDIPRRSDLLRAVQEDEKERLFAALKNYSVQTVT